jgi:hypothetical protein
MLQNAGTNLSVPALTDVVTHRVPHEAMRVFKEVLASLGFVLRIPYLQLGGERPQIGQQSCCRISFQILPMPLLGSAQRKMEAVARI